MATLKPYADEVKDTAIDALKANLKGVIVLTSTVQNEEDEVLGDNNSNQPLRILFQVDRKIYREIVKKIICQLMKTIQHQQSMNMVLQFDEILPLAIVDEALVVIDEYFAEEVNKVVEEMKEEEKEQEEEKMAKKEEEKEGEKLEENEEEKKEEKLVERKQEENEEEKVEEEKQEEEKEEEKLEEKKEEEKEHEKLEKNVEEVLATNMAEEGKGSSDENSVDVMFIVMELNGDE
uniref:WD repeat domain 66 n=1 Tax=Solanum tuberosum TaxID=4113 RepID=M1DJV2_SOLTU